MYKRDVFPDFMAVEHLRHMLGDRAAPIEVLNRAEVLNHHWEVTRRLLEEAERASLDNVGRGWFYRAMVFVLKWRLSVLAARARRLVRAGKKGVRLEVKRRFV